MTNHRSDSQAKPGEPAKVVRLVDAKSTRKEASPPDNGVRPTREGPWDPCRYQEYEISPEFRKQIMLAKPPPVDPKLFVETFPPTTAAELLGQEKSDDDCETVTFNRNEFVVPPPASNPPLVEDQSGGGRHGDLPQQVAAEDTVAMEPAAPLKVQSPPKAPSPKSARRMKMLILAGALVGLLGGFVVSQLNKGQSGSSLVATSSEPKVAPVVTITPLLAQLPNAQPLTTAGAAGRAEPGAPPRQANDQPSHQFAAGTAAAPAKQAITAHNTISVKSKQSSSKHSAQPSKNTQSAESFPMTPDD